MRRRGGERRWCGSAGAARGERTDVGKWRLRRKGVEFDLQWEQTDKLPAAHQELSYLEGCRAHIPGGTDPFDVWGSWRGWPPCSRMSSNLGMLGLRPSLQSGGRTEAGGSNWRGDGREQFCRTGAAAVLLGPLVGKLLRAPCWAPETGRSTRSSGLIKGVWPGV